MRVKRSLGKALVQREVEEVRNASYDTKPPADEKPWLSVVAGTRRTDLGRKSSPYAFRSCRRGRSRACAVWGTLRSPLAARRLSTRRQHQLSRRSPFLVLGRGGGAKKSARERQLEISATAHATPPRLRVVPPAELHHPVGPCKLSAPRMGARLSCMPLHMYLDDYPRFRQDC